jgi:hypothetical protein
MLQSPLFLYRVEASEVRRPGGKIRLSDHEIASKLSYMLWNTMPDDELFAAADAGSLDDPGRRRPGQPACSTTRAPTTWSPPSTTSCSGRPLQRHLQGPGQVPDLRPDAERRDGQETMMFVDDVVFNDGDLATLLTAPYTFVNAALAPLYGVEGPHDDFVKVDLDPPSAPACSPRSASSPATPAPSRTTRSTAACS